MAKKKKGIMHYRSNHNILLVGEGDFSFAVCLATAFRNASNMVATSLVSKGNLIAKYSASKENLEVLKEKNCIILHGINAHTMSNHVFLHNQRFGRIVFNFPHAVHALVRYECDDSQIKLHQKLVRGFFLSASKLLSYKGEVHITHKTTHPFDQWNITELAKEAGFELMAEFEFNKWDYPGYCNKRGDAFGVRCNKTFPIGECSTFMFRLV